MTTADIDYREFTDLPTDLDYYDAACGHHFSPLRTGRAEHGKPMLMASWAS